MTQKLEEYKSLLKKHRYPTASDQEIFNIIKNVQNLANIITAFERKQRLQSFQNKKLTHEKKINESNN